MNVSLIIIVILIMILISILYIYYYSNKNNLNNYLDLSKSALPTISSANLVVPKSKSYSYSFWLFITNPSTSTARYNFITREKETAIGFGKHLYVNCIDKKTYIDVYKDVPSQKWIHVIINRTPTLLECYINGKLNISKNLSDAADTYTPEQYGNIIFSTANAYISKLQRWEKPITSSEASNMYYNGNGYSIILPNINVVASVLENDVVQKEVSIF